MTSIGDQKYVSVTTFRRTGDGVSTATWITPLPGGRLGFWTSSRSGKVKRLRNDPRITLVPSDARGRTRDASGLVSGTAQVVESGTDYDTVRSQITSKYGVMVPISKFFNALGHIGKGPYPYGDVVVMIARRRLTGICLLKRRRSA